MGEFYLMLAGYFRRDDKAWEHTGAQGMWIQAPYTRKKMTVDKVVGRKLQTQPIHDYGEPD